MRRHGEDVPEDKVPKDYRGVYVGGSGVWVDRKHVATLAEIDAKRGELAAAIDADAKLLPTVGYSGLVAALDLHAEPAAQAISALRLFVGRETYFTRPHRDPGHPAAQDLADVLAAVHRPARPRAPTPSGCRSTSTRRAPGSACPASTSSR